MSACSPSYITSLRKIGKMSIKGDILEKLISLGFTADYIVRAFKTYEKNFGFNYNVEVMTEIILRLQKKDKSKQQRNHSESISVPDSNEVPNHQNQANPATVPRSTMNQKPITSIFDKLAFKDACNLKVGDKIDHQDIAGRFLLATVIDKQGTNLKIHYDEWSSKWDIWSDFSKEIHRFASAGSISRRKCHRLLFFDIKKGDYVDINPRRKHPGWTHGEICSLDSHSGQVQVAYKSMGKNWLYWVHLDDTNEIAEFTSKSEPTNHIEVRREIDLSKECASEKEPDQAPIAACAPLRDRVVRALTVNNQLLVSVVQSLDDDAIAGLDTTALIKQIERNQERMMRIIRGEKGVESDDNSRKKKRKRKYTEFIQFNDRNIAMNFGSNARNELVLPRKKRKIITKTAFKRVWRDCASAIP